MSGSKKHVRFDDANIFYSPKSTPSPSFSDSSLPSSGDSSGPHTPPQNSYPLPLPTGPVGIHPVLAFHPYIPPINYDVSLPPLTFRPNVHASSMGPPAGVLDEPATRPSVHTLTLIINQLPWRLTTPPTNHYVSVRDLLEALYRFLYHPVLPSEYNGLPTQTLKDDISRAFHDRCGRAPSHAAANEQYHQGVKRLDFLLGQTRFMGLSSTKVGPNVWQLNLA